MSSQAAVARQYYDALKVWDLPALKALLSADFVHEFRPASLAGMGAPTRNADELIELYSGLQKLLPSLGLQEPKQTIVGENAIVSHVVSNTKRSFDGKEFSNDVIIIFNFSGDKISKVTEFMDSQAVALLGADEKAAKA